VRNEILRRIFDACLAAAGDNGEFTLSRLLDGVDDPELKSLIVWIDEQGLAKGLAGKMTESGYDDDGCPLLLKRSLDNLSWREAEQAQQTVEARLSQETDSPGELDAETEALLRAAAEFHQRRATKKSAG
jgi:DNA primase